MNLHSNIDKIIKTIKKMNCNSSDIITRIIENGNNRIGYIFLETVSSDDKISNFLNKSIINIDKKNIFNSLYKRIKNKLFNSNIKRCGSYEELFYFLSSGFTAILVDGKKECIVVETRTKLDRGVVESTSETRNPKYMWFAVPNELYELLRKAVYANATILPIPRNASYSDEERKPEIDSTYIQNYILAKSVNFN